MSETLIDARGMRCPWPALRLAKAMGEGGDVILLADDPAAPAEIAALAEARGWEIDRQNERFRVLHRAPIGNR